MKLTYALLRKQRTHNLRYIVQTLLMKLAPDFLNNVKIGHGQLTLIIQTYLVLPYMGMVAILVKYYIYIY